MAAVLVVAALVAGARWWPRSIRSGVANVELGRLPAGVDPARLNLVVVTLDTTRADRMGAYGYADAGTPAFDRLARDGVCFEHASTAAPLTLPAHSTIFTGRFPPAHGVRDNGGFYLNDREETLAEVLKKRGYATAGFVAAYVLDSKWGIAQGFDTYFDNFDLTKYRAISLGAIQRPGNEVVDHALPWLEQHAASPFFAWIHLYDAHTPYEPPEPFRARYPGQPYQGEISFADAQLGRVVQFLEGRNLLDRTVIVVMGDHGESLDDHGEGQHGFFIYESVVRVPFVIRAPFSLMAHRRVADPVRSADVMPTVLDLLGVAKPSVPLDGESLTPLMTGARAELGLEAYSEALYPLHHFGWSDLRALRQGRYKVIAAPRPELYDLQDDPREQKNIFEPRRTLGDRMLGRLGELEAHFAKTGAPTSQAVEVDPDARARLAALGYVGSFVATSTPGSRTGLADPKDKVSVFNKITEARDISKDESAFPRVVALLKDILADDPKVIDAWFMLGNTYSKAGKYEESIEYFKRALALKPDDDMAVVNMANAYRRLGRDEDALIGYRRFLQLDPKNAQVRYEIAQILIDRQNNQEAAQELRQALQLEPSMAAARNALGVVALNQGDLAGAEAEIRQALTQKPDVRLAHYNLALIAEKRGDARLAAVEYQQELSLHPTNFKAAFNLGKIFEQAGDPVSQEAAYRKAIEGNPQFAEGYFYLAKLLLDRGQRFDEAVTLAKKGLEVGPRSEYAALGHYVLADLYNRLGRPTEAAVEAQRGRALETSQAHTARGTGG